MYEAELRLPATIGDYTDFYASIDHARNVGSMFRPNDPLLPNYKYVPIGYHGRASSIVLTGTQVRRPAGQIRDDPEQPPAVAPSRRLDYELELGIFVGTPNALGSPVPIIDADRHIFSCCRTTRATAATCDRATSWPAAPSPAPSPIRGGRSSNGHGEVAIRSTSQTERRGRSWSMATR